jgi:hypothetical protein
LTRTRTAAKRTPSKSTKTVAKAVAKANGRSVQQQAREQSHPIPVGDDPEQVHSELMLITPALAEDWLGRNSHNRPIRQQRIDTIVGAIQRGEWRLNGDAIRFGKDGALQDGQHRLWAIWLCSDFFDQPGNPKGVESLVVTGLDSEAQETMDTGARRNLKDTLALRGVSNASKLAAVVAYKWKLDTAQLRMVSARPTIQQALATLEAHPGLEESSRAVHRMLQRFRISSAMIAVVHYELAGIDPDDAGMFFDKLVEGAGLEEGDPILVLRHYLERQSMAGMGSRASSLITHAVIIKAWNAWRSGVHVTQLSWKAAGLKAEAFPEPR